MTCPFYVCDGRPSCLLGEPDGRHCGPRQYPVGPCNLDLVGEWGAWRAVRLLLGVLYCRWEYYMGEGCELVALWYEEQAFAALDAVGWSP